MSKLIMIRHGKSVWNELNIFTGCVDIPLSRIGIQEAIKAGEEIADIPIDIIYSSALIRAQMTALLAMSMHNSNKVPVILHSWQEPLENWNKIYSEKTASETIPMMCAWQLNERMYGELQGMNKTEMAQRFGDEQIKTWRRSYNIAPPQGESLALTAARTIPYFEEQIMPQLIAERNVLIVAHGNSLRSIIMDLDNLSKDEIVSLEIPTGIPMFYEYKDGNIYKL